MLASDYASDDQEAARHFALMTLEERIAAEWDAANRLPPGEREAALDIMVIKHGAVLQATLRDRAIVAEPGKVISLADRRSKLPRGL